MISVKNQNLQTNSLANILKSRYTVKLKLIRIDMDRFIIHYDWISTANTLLEITVTTLSTLQDYKAIREDNLGRSYFRHEQGNGILENLDKHYFYHPECFKNMFMLRHLQNRNRVKMHLNLRVQKEKSARTKWDFLGIILWFVRSTRSK